MPFGEASPVSAGWRGQGRFGGRVITYPRAKPAGRRGALSCSAAKDRDTPGIAQRVALTARGAEPLRPSSERRARAITRREKGRRLTFYSGEAAEGSGITFARCKPRRRFAIS